MVSTQSKQHENMATSWAGEFIKIVLDDGNLFLCQINDITIQSGVISNFECFYSGMQQMLI